MTTALGPRPGTKLEFIGYTLPRVLPSFSEVVAVPITHDWGPLNHPELCLSPEEFYAKFGDSDTPGRTAVIQAFQGQGFENTTGAGGVIVYRMGVAAGGGAAVKATFAVQNTAPATALTLNAKYHGTRGNRISFSVADDPTDAARDIFAIRFDGVIRERYYYANTDITGLVAQINARTDSLVTATLGATGVALSTTAGTSLAAGVDGTTLTVVEWQAALDALENADFSVFAPFDLTDGAIQAVILSWLRAMEEASKPVVAVVGGGNADNVGTAIARSAALADPHVVNLGVGVYTDALLEKDLNTSQLAPRIAGILAARGDAAAITFAKLGGLTLAEGSALPADDEIVQAIEAGVTVISLAASADAELKIERGVTTFTSKVDAAHPYGLFSDPRIVRLTDIYTRGMRQWGDDNIIGGTVVNDNTRALVRGEGSRKNTALEERGLIEPASGFCVVVEDPDNPDAIPFEFGFVPSRTTNYVRGKGRIR